MPLDTRVPISDQAKQLVDEAFAQLPPDKRGALVIVADEKEARAHVAARLNEGWKVALTGSTTYRGAVSGQVAIVGSW